MCRSRDILSLDTQKWCASCFSSLHSTRSYIFFSWLQANPEDRKHDAEMKELFPDFRVLYPSELPHGVASGVAFTTVSTRSCMPLVHDGRTLDPSP
jgi:hypothetical protein